MVGLVDKPATLIAILPAVTEIMKNHTLAGLTYCRVCSAFSRPRAPDGKLGIYDLP